MIVGEPFSPYRAFTGIFIPESLVPYRGISAGEKICLARLYRYCGKADHCWPSQEELAEELGVDVRTIGRYLESLEREKFIEISRKGLGENNTYKMVGHEVLGASPTRHNCPISTGQECSDQDQTDLSDSTYSTEEGQKKESHVEGDPSAEEPVADFKTLLSYWRRHRFFKRPTKAIERKAELRWKHTAIRESEIPDSLDAYEKSQWAKNQNYPLLGYAKDPLSWQKPEDPLPTADGWKNNNGLLRLKVEFEAIGAPVIDADWEDALEPWESLSDADQEKAIGQVHECDGAFIRRPKNYILKREFDRKPRPTPKSRITSLLEQA